MATRLYFSSGRELAVDQPEDDVVFAVRRDHPNPVRLSAGGGGDVHVNWEHVDFIAPDNGHEAQ